jgi:hypothetical protein
MSLLDPAESAAVTMMSAASNPAGASGIPPSR